MIEHRKQKRYNINNKLFLKNIHKGFVKDISLGGIKICVKKINSIDFPETFIIKILSENFISNNIEIKCALKWQSIDNDYIYYGIEFLNMNNHNTNKLKQLIDYLTILGSNFEKIKVEIIIL